MRQLKYLSLVIFTFFSISTFAGEFPSKAYISVTGEAKLEVMPDKVTIKIQAYALEKSAKLALEKVNVQVDSFIKKLKKSDFNAAKLDSSSVNVRPEYTYEKNKKLLVGYQATRDLSYVLIDLNRINSYIDLVVAAGIERISQLEYALQDPMKYNEQVRLLAVNDSKNKAKTVTKAYGAKLGKVYSINYQGRSSRPVMMRDMSLSSSKNSNYQVQNIILNDRIEAVFLLK